MAMTQAALAQQESGRITVDPLAAERALERSLVREGALLLAPGQQEFTPSLGLDQGLRQRPVRIDFGDGANGVGEVESDRARLTQEVEWSIGLPGELQFSIGVPWIYARNEETVRAAGALPEAGSDDGSAIGDPRAAIAIALLREGRLVPDVVGRLDWNSGFGSQQRNDLREFGDGGHELRATLTMLKRQDPLVFTGSMHFEHAWQRDGFKPGNRFGLTVGTSLAASPRTSLRFGYAAEYSEDARLDGRRIQGSDGIRASFSIGASACLSRALLFDLGLAIGLNDNSADYALTIALPIRFD